MDKHLQPSTFAPPRRRWPGIMAATVVGLAIALAAAASWTDLGSLLHLSRADDGALDENDITAVLLAGI